MVGVGIGVGSGVVVGEMGVEAVKVGAKPATAADPPPASAIEVEREQASLLCGSRTRFRRNPTNGRICGGNGGDGRY